MKPPRDGRKVYVACARCATYGPASQASELGRPHNEGLELVIVCFRCVSSFARWWVDGDDDTARDAPERVLRVAASAHVGSVPDNEEPE